MSFSDYCLANIIEIPTGFVVEGHKYKVSFSYNFVDTFHAMFRTEADSEGVYSKYEFRAPNGIVIPLSVPSSASVDSVCEFTFDAAGTDSLFKFFLQGSVSFTPKETLSDTSCYMSIQFTISNLTVTDITGGITQDSDNHLANIDDESKKQTDIMEEQKETSKNIFQAIADFFGGFFDGIINAFKGLFIPEDGYFSDFFGRLNDFFAEKLGVLYAPVDMFIDILLGVANADTADGGIPFPGIVVDGNVILPAQTVSISTILGNFPGLQDKVYFATDILMIGAVLWLLQGKLKEVLQK